MVNAPSIRDLDAGWERHARAWRDPAQVATYWADASAIDPKTLETRTRGAWWETVAKCGVTLLITREYEHLVVALSAVMERPHVTYLPLPHPSGVAVDRRRGVIHVASTRNPNQIFDLVPVTSIHDRLDVDVADPTDRPLVPIRTRFLPGSLYIHDLAVMGRSLLANAVGYNAIARLRDSGSYEFVWWPKVIGKRGTTPLGRNHLQLNSIAAGRTLRRSYFSASTDRVTARRPGHKNFTVDRRGVIFSGTTREPVVYGLTRPHSARLHESKLWVDNSGYGELALCDLTRGTFEAAARLPGWTRGLCCVGGVAFVGTSRVIPRFRQYAPGLDVDQSRCGVHAVDLRTGAILGSLVWPYGNQIFAVEWVPQRLTSGFPFAHPRRRRVDPGHLFYAFRVPDTPRSRAKRTTSL